MRRANLIEAREGKNLSQTDLAERLQCSEDSVSRWERGTASPGPFARREIQAFFAVEDLDAFLALTADEQENDPTPSILTLVLPNSLQSFFSNNMIMRLLHIAHTNYSTSDEMTNAIQVAIKEINTMNLDPITRREAMLSLASLPAITLGQKHTLKTSRYEEMIRHCTAALEACWELYRGSDPVGTQHAFDCVSTYEPLLEVIAKDSSQYRKEAIELATRYALLQTILSWGCAIPTVSAGYAQHARDLSKEQGDILLQLSTSTKLNWTYLISKQYTKAWKVMQEGEHILNAYQRKKKGPPLPIGIIGNFYSASAQARVHNGIDPDTALGIALDSEPLSGQIAFVSFAASAQWSEAAWTYNAKGDSRQAMKWLEKAIDPGTLVPHVPQSIGGRVGTMNLLTNALLQSKERDMNHIIRVWKVGMEGAQALKHEIKYQEALLNFAVMRALWPGENAIRKLAPLTAHW